MIIAALIIFSTLLNSLNFFIGMLLTPKDSVFLGTTHWPADYFYYLSQFAQGKESWFSSHDLYTSDFAAKTYVGWVNVFVGRVFHLFGINQFWAYQISVAIFTALFLWLSYLLIRQIFPDRHTYSDPGSDRKRIVAFALFNFANAWPAIQVTGARINLFYHDFWFNNGVPFNRLVSVPHQMLGKSMLVLAILLFIWWIKGRRKIWILLGTALVSITLVSVEPIHWILVLITFIIFYLIKFPISLLAQRNGGKKGQPGGGFRISLTSGSQGGPRPASWRAAFPLLPLGKRNYENAAEANIFIPLFFFLSGLPMLIYLKKLFSLPPYSQLALWEATQQQYVGVWHFLASNGPVVLLAIWGIWLFIRQLASQGEPLQSWPRMIAVVFTIITVGLFFSPIPAMVSIVNVRFLPAATTIFFAVLATEAIYKLPKRRLILAVVFILSLLPLPSQIQKRITFDTNNSYYFLSQSAIEAFNHAEKVSSPADTFLVIWFFNTSFPAVSARRVYGGHHLLTIDSAKKEELVWKFFDGQMSTTQMREFLSKNGIDFIISYSWTAKMGEVDGLEKVYDNGYLAVYAVR